MPTIYIDNKPYQVKDGQNLLQAALSQGLDLPYFCWHPALGSVGACRQCAVQQFKDETDTKGKMIMSCMTPCTEGTRISIDHADAKAFRASVIEWMMTNHPHDCPICDEGGECHLQDMTVMTGHNYRNYRFKKRTFENQNLGPHINHEMNRCITCYRCVRYYRDYAGGTDLHAFASADRVYFGRDKDGKLENEFSGNLVEICPTGVFTDKVFKESYTRKWDLQTAPSICQLCSVGCNISPGERYGTLRRVQNRFNDQINGYFLCDRGRFEHGYVNAPERIQKPIFLGHSPLPLGGKNWIGIGSPRASLESNFALRQLVGEKNFYAGMAPEQSKLMEVVVAAMDRFTAPSIKEIEQSDAIAIVGEDLLVTAPRLGLAVRQAVHQKAVREAAQKGIPEWNDAAVRNLGRDKKGEIFIWSAGATKLDEIARVVVMAGNPPAPFAKGGEVWGALERAKHPVVISGVSAGKEMLEKAIELAGATKAKLCLVAPEVNSVGLMMMKPRHLDEALARTDCDGVIVIENDLFQRLPKQECEKFLTSAKQLVVIDSLPSETQKLANTTLPATTFLEGAGTVVNYEGRAQRYYRVIPPKAEMQDSWRWLSDQFGNLDEITAAMSNTMPVFAGIAKTFPSAEFRVNGQKIPRQEQGASGRTAVLANMTVHEPKPPQDPDSPLAHSMEGFSGQPPPGFVSFFWKPAWNSVQSLNKYQTEIGGPLKNAHEDTHS